MPREMLQRWFELKKEYFRAKAMEQLGKRVERSSEEIEKEIKEIEEKLSAKGVSPFFVYQREFEEIEKAFETLSIKEKLKIATNPSHPLYPKMKRRMEILKKNFEMAEYITQLIEMEKANYSSIRKILCEGEAIVFSPSWKETIKILNALGFPYREENGTIMPSDTQKYEAVKLNGKIYILEKEKAEKIKEINEKLSSLNKKIQLVIAKSQVGQGNAQELEQAQREYLELTKEQQKILNE